MMRIRLFLLFLLFGQVAFAQAPSATLNGQVVDKLSNQPIPFAPVQISGTTIGTTTDEQGRFEFRGLTPGIYNIEVTSVGYDKAAVFEIDVSSTRVRPVRVELVARSTELEEVTVRPDPFVKLEEAPVSVYNVGEVEIKRNPGANRDISKALQSLPGVAATASFRNDLIIRGGSSNENRFYLDGIEVPNINHFATQGSTGGPVGMINVDFIREVDFYSSAFPAARGNTLSSVMDFKLKEGRAERLGYTLTLGASDLAATVDGPLSDKVNFIASWRRSYLQFLFKAIGLPFLPTYDDFLVKTKWKIDDRNEITFLGLGADDRVRLNLEQDETDLQQYLLNNLPVNTQWNYTVGAVYRRYRTNGYSLFALSRNQLQNDAEKFQDNDASSENNRLLDYSSRETENKFRYEQVERIGSQKLTVGINLESAEYTNRTFNRVPYVGEVRYQSDISFYKAALFVQWSISALREDLTLSAGFRLDANTFNDRMQRPQDQFSPRLSLSYRLSDRFRFNANAGRYFQLPAYTILGFRDNAGTLVNKVDARYMQCDHLVAGFEYTAPSFVRITLEGFYKNYSQYPFNLRDSISIANQGSDFGTVGTVPVRFDNRGRSYGVEFMVQQKLFKKVFGILAYTLLRSEFESLDGAFLPSSWDFRHVVSLTGGKYFPKNWQVGFRFRFNSGTPYTPFDVAASVERSNFDVTGQGIPDRSAINSRRTDAFHQLDLRIDKKYYYKKWSLNFFLDVQNVYNQVTEFAPYVSVQRNANGQPIVDPNNTDAYLPLLIPNEAGSLIPSIGIVAEF
ncbi:MAG: TonB-dependent receptor [Bacteroidia bacterium]|nr:TonB-dependent receptor [Bacteroidia bacterium]MBP7269697.1 TonB-dependent receptor [Bacteroidia bacterium]MBP7437257.1 TonB-dependent receptor [Bacteroidia bacterium]MBP7770959.1 TonB-dependent receptor [Bacteroidia bacterium]